MKLITLYEGKAQIAGRDYDVSFQKAKRVAMSLGATRFTYDGMEWVFHKGKWAMQT